MPYDSEQLDDSTDILQDTEVSDHLFEDGKKPGWALRKQKPVKRFTEKQIQFLVKINDDGEKTKAKKDAVTVTEMMRTAVDENQMKLFSTSEYLRREQIVSFFSRITASRRLGKHKGQSEVDDETEACVAEECLEELEANNEMEFVEETLQAIIVSREEELDKEDDEGISDFVALRAGKTTWYMAQVSDVDHEKMEVEVNYIKKSGHSFIFTEEKPSWIGMDQIIYAQCQESTTGKDICLKKMILN